MVSGEGESHGRPYKEMDVVGGSRRELFDEQTCYPIRRWRGVQEEGPQAPLIRCCYEANWLD